MYVYIHIDVYIWVYICARVLLAPMSNDFPVHTQIHRHIRATTQQPSSYTDGRTHTHCEYAR